MLPSKRESFISPNGGKDPIEIRPIPDCPGYFAAKHGAVLSIKSGFVKELSARLNEDGYKRATLSVDSVRVESSIHRLVAKTWLGMPKPGEQVNHKNGIKTDNRVENLEWVSVKENNIHAINVLGKRRGENNALAKLTEDQVRAIRADTRILTEIAKDYGIYFSTVHKIKKRESWRHVKD
jgi:hypothetical protein